jgi:ArsR family transcriptional regulator
MKNIVTFSKALADPTRWRIIRLVMNHALCVCELADILEMPQSSVSSHVQIIRRAGLLESEKCEKWTYFQIHEDYQELILSLSGFFHGSDSLFFQNDTTRSIQRLTERDTSCCPGPQILTSKKLTTV